MNCVKGQITLKIEFYCREEQIPMHYFEAMQIFSHIFGMPDIICGAVYADSLEKLVAVRDEGSIETVEISLDKAKNSAISDDALFASGRLNISDENLLKRYLYLCLSNIYGYKSPWGCMTGVRPAKIVNRLMESGFTEAEVREHFINFFLMSNEKADLVLDAVHVQRPFIEEQKQSPQRAGFYVGIPFCPTRCTYCSFAASPIGQYKKRVDEYLDVLEQEIEQTIALFDGKYIIESVYIGGGTPTALNSRQLERLFNMLMPLFKDGTVREFALEAGRPDSIDAEKLRIAKKYGVNRISVNPQTMNLKTLEAIGRKHTPEDTLRAFRLVKNEGFPNVNMDIIAGLPGETIEDFNHTLEIIKELSPDSLTVHTLSIKRASELRYDEAQRAELRSDVTGEMTSAAGRLARSLGMRPFYMYRQKNQLGNHENVCYCRPGCESPYNIHIMEEDQTIIACGCGAVSKFVSSDGQITRSFNMKGIPEYMERLDVMMERKRKFC